MFNCKKSTYSFGLPVHEIVKGKIIHCVLSFQALEQYGLMKLWDHLDLKIRDSSFLGT